MQFLILQSLYQSSSIANKCTVSTILKTIFRWYTIANMGFHLFNLEKETSQEFFLGPFLLFLIPSINLK